MLVDTTVSKVPFVVKDFRDSCRIAVRFVRNPPVLP